MPGPNKWNLEPHQTWWCGLSSVPYTVDGSVGVTSGYKKGVRFVFDTGAGLKIVRRNAIWYGWEKGVDQEVVSPKLSDANGNTLELGKVVWLTTRFGKMVFKVRFMIAEKLAVHALIGTAFMDRHVFSIRC